MFKLCVRDLSIHVFWWPWETFDLILHRYQDKINFVIIKMINYVIYINDKYAKREFNSFFKLKFSNF